MNTEEALDKVDSMMEQIKPIFSGVAPNIQGAVLGNVVALWLGGHYMAGESAIEYLLEMHIKQVRELVPIYIDELRDRA